MPTEMIVAIILIAGLMILIFLGVEIALSVGIISVLGLILYVDQPINQVMYTFWHSLNSFTLTALPLFIFMGSLLGNTGVNQRLFSALDKFVGSFPGGLACTVIAGNATFGAMSGSSMAAVATFGKIAFPVMEEKGYAPRLALGVIASADMLSPLIPPSIMLILYGSWQGISIVDLLAAGLIPGITLMVLFMLTIMVIEKIKPSWFPSRDRYSWKEKITAVWQILPFMVMIIGVLSAIFGGFMTPTEASALGAFFSIVLTAAYRRLTFKILLNTLLETVKVTSFCLFIMAMASLISHVFNSAGIIPMIKDYVIALPIGKYGILVFFFVMYFFLGMLFDSWSMLFLTFPFVMPIISSLGFDLVWWGVVYVMAGVQASMTPPFGLSLFVLHSVVPWHPMGTIVRGALPFLIPIYLNILLLILFPQLALWFPSLL
jgi:tripartite ATP-independent transporter DctM subunit